LHCIYLIFIGIVLNTKKASGLIGKLSIDEHLQYSFDAKLVRDVSDSSYIYKPSFELQANNKIITTANGMMTLKKNLRQCDIEFSIDGEVTGPFSTQCNDLFSFFSFIIFIIIVAVILLY
jgi:hypothetical protein